MPSSMVKMQILHAQGPLQREVVVGLEEVLAGVVEEREAVELHRAASLRRGLEEVAAARTLRRLLIALWLL